MDDILVSRLEDGVRSALGGYSFIGEGRSLRNTVNRYLYFVKVFCILFALCTAFVSIYPCSESECEEEVAVADSDGHSEDEDCKGCTPFCAAPCCAVHVINSWCCYTIVKENPVAVVKRFIYTAQFPASIIIPIWQPPKVA